jgi:hypothetical protein
VNYAQFANQEAAQAVGAKIIGDKENHLLTELRVIATPDSRVYDLCAILEG